MFAYKCMADSLSRLLYFVFLILSTNKTTNPFSLPRHSIMTNPIDASAQHAHDSNEVTAPAKPSLRVSRLHLTEALSLEKLYR